MSSTSCPVDLDTKKLHTAVSDMYARVAAEPDGDFHFHRGPGYATQLLGYDPEELGALPERATRSFAGVGNPHAIAPLQSGETILDIGSGAGTDLLLAARRVGSRGRAIGVDMTDAMIEACRAAAHEAGLDNVEVRRGDLHDLPVEDASVDVVISNGVLNLAHDKQRAFADVFRVLRPGGRLQLADIVVQDELSESIRSDYELWAA
ncbi:MAG: methyltransferase domain-containing protein [Acidobacteriota bacterium]|jgi:SAM-dependent methyltransferase